MEINHRDPFGRPVEVEREVANALRFMRSLRRLGRAGGLVALGLGSALVAGGGITAWKTGPWNGTDGWWPEVVVLALVALTAGLAFGGFGLYTLARPHRMASRPTREAFLSFLRKAAKPVRVCVACRAPVPADRDTDCERCLSGASCFVVASETDVTIVATVLRASGGDP